MKFDLEEQEGVYFLKVYYMDTSKRRTCPWHSYGTAIFDTKRGTYYLEPSKKHEFAETFIEVMESLFISSLAPIDDNGYSKYNEGWKTGDLAPYAKKKFIELCKLYGIDMPNLTESNCDEELESKSDKEYYKHLHEYNLGLYPESKML